MPLFSKSEQISSRCSAHIEAFRKLCEFHSLRSGSPADFLQLAPKLATSEGFRLDLSDLARTIRDRERGRLSAADMLTIVGLAVGGPGVAAAGMELREAAGTVQVLLAGVGGWREVDDVLWVGAAGAGSAGQTDSGEQGSEAGRGGERVPGSGDGERRAGHGSDGEVSPEMRETLERLELANMQLKVYLDDIDRRMGRIEPHLGGSPGAQAPVERNGRSIWDGWQDRGKTEARGDRAWADGLQAKPELTEPKLTEPEAAAEPTRSAQEPEPKAGLRSTGSESRVIWYEAARTTPEIRRPTRTGPTDGGEAANAATIMGFESADERAIPERVQVDETNAMEGAGAKPGRWAWGATAAAVLVAATVVTLYGPWRLAGSGPLKPGAEVAEPAGNRPEVESPGTRAEGVRADAALVTRDGAAGGGTGTGAGVVGASKGRGGAANSSRTGAARRAGSESPSPGTDIAEVRSGIDGSRVAGPTGVQGSGGGSPVASEPAALASSSAVSAVPAGTNVVPKGAASGLQGEAAKNRVEGARAEDPARGTRVEDLRPDDSATRPAAVGVGTPAHVEIAASIPAPLPSTRVAEAARATPGVVAASTSPGAGAPGGARDVPRSSAGRAELTPVTIGGTILSAPTPIYPQQARQMGVEGKVTIRATVDRTGAVASLQVVDGPGLLLQSAQDAVKRRRYKPFLLHGEAVEFQTVVTLNYKLAR